MALFIEIFISQKNYLAKLTDEQIFTILTLPDAGDVDETQHIKFFESLSPERLQAFRMMKKVSLVYLIYCAGFYLLFQFFQSNKKVAKGLESSILKLLLTSYQRENISDIVCYFASGLNKDILHNLTDDQVHTL